MRMHVNQAGQNSGAWEINDNCPGNVHQRLHSNNPVIFYKNLLMFEKATSLYVQYLLRPNDDPLWTFRRSQRCCRRKECGRKKHTYHRADRQFSWRTIANVSPTDQKLHRLRSHNSVELLPLWQLHPPPLCNAFVRSPLVCLEKFWLRTQCSNLEHRSDFCTMAAAVGRIH